MKSEKDLCSSSHVCRMTLKCECELLMPWFSLDLMPTLYTLFNAHVLTYTRKEACSHIPGRKHAPNSKVRLITKVYGRQTQKTESLNSVTHTNV